MCLIKQGATASAVGKELAVPPATVAGRAKAVGIGLSQGSTGGSADQTADTMGAAADLIDAGVSVAEIADRVGKSVRTIYLWKAPGTDALRAKARHLRGDGRVLPTTTPLRALGPVQPRSSIASTVTRWDG